MKLLLVKNTAKLKKYNKNDIVSIYDDNQEIYGDELQQIKDGVFDLVTVTQTREEIDAMKPLVKRVWLDTDDGQWKEINKHPSAILRYFDGKIIHNFGNEDDNKKIVNGSNS